MIVDLSLKMLMCVKYTFSQSICVNLSLCDLNLHYINIS